MGPSFKDGIRYWRRLYNWALKMCISYYRVNLMRIKLKWSSEGKAIENYATFTQVMLTIFLAEKTEITKHVKIWKIMWMPLWYLQYFIPQCIESQITLDFHTAVRQFPVSSRKRKRSLATGALILERNGAIFRCQNKQLLRYLTENSSHFLKFDEHLGYSLDEIAQMV